MADAPHISLDALPATDGERRRTLSVICVLALALLLLIPFGHIRLPEVDGFIPLIQGISFLGDLTTGVLLLGQFSVHRSRAVLILAAAYILMAAMIAAHTLAFPGVLGPQGLVGGLQTAGWLYTISRFCFPAGIIWYSLSNKNKMRVQRPPAKAIGWILCGIVSGVVALTVGLTTADNYLPPLFLNRLSFSPLVFYTGLFNVLVALVAFAILLAKRSVLSCLLQIPIAAIAAEAIGVTFLSGGRYDLAWYFVRVFSIVCSMSVLVALLFETAALYRTLWDAFMRLRHENESRMLNLELLAGLFSHELKQPLTAIAVESEAALIYLNGSKADINQAQESLKSIFGGVTRANCTLESIRSLFRPELSSADPLDLEQIAQEALILLKHELKERSINVRTEFAKVMPLVQGHRGQILQAVVNLINNATEAMISVPEHNRILTVRTDRSGTNDAVLEVSDTGPGITPELESTIFDPLVTSKSLGTGLGLALCRNVAERHGGNVSASSGEGGGAQFRLILPGRGEQLTSSAAEWETPRLASPALSSP